MIQFNKNAFILANGVKIPAIGLGCGFGTPYPGDKLTENILYAVNSGYRSIDTATQYGTEDAVGAAIERSPIARSELFITTKLHNDSHDYKIAKGALEVSLKYLRTSYVDMYLIHFPGAGTDPAGWKFVDVWKAFEEMYQAGKIRAIGVSNFRTAHLEELLSKCEIPPMVNQIERHPYYQQRETVELCKQNDILVEAWSPLSGLFAGQKQALLDNPVIAEIAAKHDKTPAQAVLRWHIDTGGAAAVRSTNHERIQNNIDIFDFQLTPDEIEAIDNLECGQNVGPLPENFFNTNTIHHLMAKRIASTL